MSYNSVEFLLYVIKSALIDKVRVFSENNPDDSNFYNNATALKAND